MASRLPGFVLFHLLMVAATAATAPPASGQSLAWMTGRPAEFFTDEDWSLLGSTLDQALNEAADGETREWRNASSGASGTVTPLSSETRQGLACRLARIVSRAAGTQSSQRYLFCRQGEDGRWQIGLVED